MKNNELRLPLIQSGLVLVVIFLLIAFVAGSDAHGVVGGITSIFKGFFFSILFVIALAVAVIFSIILLIAIFLGTVALYSPETSKELFGKLQQSSSALIATYTSCCAKDATCSSADVGTPPSEDDSSAKKDSWKKYVVKKEALQPGKVEAVDETLSLEIKNIENEVNLLQTKNTELSSSLSSLKESFDELSASEMVTRTDNVESRQDGLTEKIDATQKKLEDFEATSATYTQSSNSLGTKIDGLQGQLTTLTEELNQLKKKYDEQTIATSVEEKQDASEDTKNEVHRIFSYILDKKDRELFASSIAEAVAKEMSYAKIDDFLTQSLSKKVDTIIKDHPSLTKDYIRDCRKTK